MKKNLSSKIIIVLIAVMGLVACGPQNSQIIRDMARIPPSPSGSISPDGRRDSLIDDNMARQEIRIGVLLPLSGKDAPIGRALFNAATLALFDSGDRRLKLLPHDTRGTEKGATDAMIALLTQKPDLIIGPLFSQSITAIKPLAREARINVIGFSSDHKVAGDGIFLMSFRMEEQIERVIGFASDRGYARYAALVPETPYGVRAMEIFGKAVINQQRDLISVEFYPPDSTSMVGPVKTIAKYDERRKRYKSEVSFLKRLGEEDDFGQEMLDEIKNLETLGDVEFDAILLPEGGSLLTTLAAWVSYYEIDPTQIKILGTGLWDDDMLFHEPQLFGGWFATPDRTLSHKFLKRYNKIFDQNSPRLVTLAYDAVALAATLVRQEKIPDFSREKLTYENGFSGIEGLFRFSPDGLIERGLAVYEVEHDRFTIIDPAPLSFIDQDQPEVMTESATAENSAAASLSGLPAADDRPFPYNPVQRDAANKTGQ